MRITRALVLAGIVSTTLMALPACGGPPAESAAAPEPTGAQEVDRWQDPATATTVAPTASEATGNETDPAAAPTSAPEPTTSPTPATGRRLSAVTVEPSVDGRPASPLRWRPGAERATARCGVADDTGTPTLMVEVIDRSSPDPTFGVRLTVSPFPGPGEHPVTGTVLADSPAERPVTGTIVVGGDRTSGSFSVRGTSGPAVSGSWRCTFASA